MWWCLDLAPPDVVDVECDWFSMIPDSLTVFQIC
jgi:hypothetical protein